MRKGVIGSTGCSSFTVSMIKINIRPAICCLLKPKRSKNRLHEMRTPHSEVRLAGQPSTCGTLDVSSLTDLGPVLDPIVRRRSSQFGHVARHSEDTPAHQALRCHIDMSLGRLPDPSWRRCLGRPRNRWQRLCRDKGTPPAELWTQAVTRGHSGVKLRSSTTIRVRR